MHIPILELSDHRDIANDFGTIIHGSDAQNDTVTYTYYDNGSRESVIYKDGTKEQYTYDANRQIKTLINRRADGSILDSYIYTYDKAGNQLTKHEIIAGVEKGTTTYTYDELNRLLTVKEPGGKSTTYEYDKAGNRNKETVTLTDTAGNSITTDNTYTYDSRNRLTELGTKVNNVLTKTTGYTYDNNGNQLTTVVKSYTNGTTVTSTITTLTNTYDLHNQLIKSITENGTTINNIYNAEGYRVGKEAITGEGDREYTRYLYEADKVILETNETGSLKARNIYGTNLLIRISGLTAYQYLYNGHADVTALLTREGNIAATYYYDAFGNILESTGNVDNSILYAGYQYDIETGLYYLNARMYDPVTARFLQEDSYKGDKNDPLSLNLYSYCMNNPLIYWDPTGHYAIYYDDTIVANESKEKKKASKASGKSEGMGKTGVNNNQKVNSNPDSHGWTVQIGLSISLGFVGGGNVTVGMSISSSPEVPFDIGPFGTLGGGLQTPAFEVGLQGIGTNASNITDLRGTGTTMGGSVGEVVSVGGEYMYGEGYSGGGGQVALGLYAPTTVEAHLMKTYTVQGSVVETIKTVKDFLSSFFK